MRALLHFPFLISPSEVIPQIWFTYSPRRFSRRRWTKLIDAIDPFNPIFFCRKRRKKSVSFSSYLNRPLKMKNPSLFPLTPADTQTTPSRGRRYNRRYGARGPDDDEGNARARMTTLPSPFTCHRVWLSDTRFSPASSRVPPRTSFWDSPPRGPPWSRPAARNRRCRRRRRGSPSRSISHATLTSGRAEPPLN